MQVPPERAQEQFLTDIAPEVHRSTQIPLLKQEPGRLLFATLGTGGGFSGVIPRRRLWGPHVEVMFEADVLGTKVTIRGSCERSVCDALQQLGSPGHWLETADQPHA
jgi:hypothetical protein